MGVVPAKWSIVRQKLLMNRCLCIARLRRIDVSPMWGYFDIF